MEGGLKTTTGANRGKLSVECAHDRAEHEGSGTGLGREGARCLARAWEGVARASVAVAREANTLHKIGWEEGAHDAPAAVEPRRRVDHERGRDQVRVMVRHDHCQLSGASVGGGEDVGARRTVARAMADR